MDETVRVVDVVVIDIIKEFELVKADDLAGTGDSFSLGKFVEGVDWRNLRVGQRLRCEYVGDSATKVLRAYVLS